MAPAVFDGPNAMCIVSYIIACSRRFVKSFFQRGKQGRVEGCDRASYFGDVPLIYGLIIIDLAIPIASGPFLCYTTGAYTTEERE